MACKTKSLEELLLEHARKPKSSLAAKNYAAFLERWEEVRAAYEKGWSYSDIWKTLHEEGIFTFSYPAFTSYIRKIKKRHEKAESEKLEGSPASPKSLPRHGPAPGNRSPNRVDLPVFGEGVKQRDDRRF